MLSWFATMKVCRGGNKLVGNFGSDSWGFQPRIVQNFFEELRQVVGVMKGLSGTRTWNERRNDRS